MTVSLSPESQRIVDERVASGRYAGAEEVVAAALAALEQQDGASKLTRDELELLYPDFHRKILDGVADSDAGRVSDGDAFFDELEREDNDAEGRRSA